MQSALGLRPGMTGDLVTADGTPVSNPRELSDGSGVLTLANLVHPSWAASVRPGERKRAPDVYMGTGVTELLGAGTLVLPRPTGVQVNMMPFLGGFRFEDTRLPPYLKPYWEALWGAETKASIRFRQASRKRKPEDVYYLSVHETQVVEGEHQRRPGLHTDFSGRLGADALRPRGEGEFKDYNAIHSWGWSHGYLEGGIFMVSNMDDTCAAWNCAIDVDGTDEDIVGRGGDIEHLRGLLPTDARVVMKANHLYWITDRTPHETLPAPRDGWRQWVRVVTKGVGAWFQDHSTPNPNGVVPDPAITCVLAGDKFGDPALLRVVPPAELVVVVGGEVPPAEAAVAAAPMAALPAAPGWCPVL